MILKIAPFDAAEVLDSEEAVEEFIAAALETEEPAFIARALATVARARRRLGRSSRKSGETED
jgi:probable addiction module antidote protein